MQQVLHPNLHATTHGALHVAAKIAWRTEQSWANIAPTFAVACECTKMFNMMSIEVATQLARIMGLSNTLASLWPSLSSCLRSHGNSLLERRLFRQNRRKAYHKEWLGVSYWPNVRTLLVWKRHMIMSADPSPLIVAYVSDLNIFLSDPVMLKTIVEVVFEHTRGLAPTLSLDKIVLVGRNLVSLKNTCAESGSY